MQKTHAFAILAPVPELHLFSGLEAITTQIDSDNLPPKVAFGTMAFELFA